MFDWIKKQHHVISFFLIVFFFFPLFWISQYNYPSGDDYHTFLQAQKLCALEAAKWWYFNWTGRYTSFFLQSLFSESHIWLTAYKIIPIALFLTGFGFLFYFIRTLFGRAFSNKESFTLSTAAYIFLVSLTPDIATGFYWLATNIQYLGAVFLTLLILALIINLNRASKLLTKGLFSFLIVILIACLAGLNEISTLFFITILFLLNYFYFIKLKRFHKPGFAFFIISVLFGLLSFLSPGNAVRAGQFGREIHVIEILMGGVGLTLYLLVELLASTPLLLASVIYLVFLDVNRDKLVSQFLFLSKLRWYWILLSLICTVTIVNIVVFTAIGTNSLVYRVKNVYVYSIVLGWFFFLTVLFINLVLEKFNFHSPKWMLGLLIAFVFLFLITGFELKLSSKNIIPFSNQTEKAFSVIKTKSIYTNAYLDIFSGRASRYYWHNERRMEQLREATGDSVEFPLHSYVPETIFIQDVNHPFGAPEAISRAVRGEILQLRYIETGPPPQPKEKF